MLHSAASKYIAISLGFLNELNDGVDYMGRAGVHDKGGVVAVAGKCRCFGGAGAI